MQAQSHNRRESLAAGGFGKKSDWEGKKREGRRQKGRGIRVMRGGAARRGTKRIAFWAIRSWPLRWRFTPFYSLTSRRSGSIVFVLRSTARTTVRCSRPSALLAEAGMTWRQFGRLNRIVNVPSGRSFTGSP